MEVTITDGDRVWATKWLAANEHKSGTPPANGCAKMAAAPSLPELPARNQ